MTPQDQEFISIPGVQYGDCMRACIASILDLPIATVPHFLRDAEGEPAAFWNGVYDFIDARGYIYLPGYMKPMPNFDGYHIIGGPSPRGNGLLHAVVGLNGQIVFDPHPSRAGLLPGYWEYDYITKG